LTEPQLNALRIEKAVQGSSIKHRKPEFATSLDQTFRRLMHRSDKQADLAVIRQKKLEGTSEQGLLKIKTDSVPLEERRWTEVSNLKKLYKNSGIDLLDPLVPRSHMPMGCVVVRFRQLRSAVWGTEPVHIEREMRASCRGSVTMEVDFRPKYFITFNPHKVLASAAGEDEEVHTPRANEAEELAEDVAKMSKKKEEICAIDRLGLRKVVKPGRKNIVEVSPVQKDPMVMYKRFMQWAVWSHQVLMVRKELGPGGLEGHLKREAAKKAEEDAELAREQDMSKRGEKKKVVRKKHPTVVDRVKKWQEERKEKQLAMDKPMTATPSVDLPASVTKAKAAQPVLGRIPMPKDADEPWMEDLLGGSRLFG